MGGDVQNGRHPGGVLGGQGGDGAHGVDPVHGHGFQICLDAGAAAGITAGDRQCCFHGGVSFAALVQRSKPGGTEAAGCEGGTKEWDGGTKLAGPGGPGPGRRPGYPLP